MVKHFHSAWLSYVKLLRVLCSFNHHVSIFICGSLCSSEISRCEHISEGFESSNKNQLCELWQLLLPDSWPIWDLHLQQLSKASPFQASFDYFLLSKSQSTSFNQCVSCSIRPWMLKSKLFVVGFRLWHLTKGDVWSWDSCHLRNGGILELQPAILTCPRSGEQAFDVIQAPRFLRR